MGDESYEYVQPMSSMQENEYELAPYTKEIEPQPHIVSDGKSSHQSVWSIPVIILIVLMCIILLLLVIIIVMIGLNWATQDATGTGFNTSSLQSLNNNSQQQCPNFTQWAEDIVTGVYQSLDPSFSSLSDAVSLNNNTLVLSLITQLNNTMQDTANKVDVMGKFNEVEESFHENNTLLLNRVIETVSSSVIKLNNIISTLSNIQGTSTSTAGVVDDILLIAQELLVLHNVSTALPTSCKQIKDERPNSPSGFYLLVTPSGTSSYYTHCNMRTLCGSGGGWTRLAYLDMSDSTVNCPSEFRLYQSGGVRACGRATSSGGSCTSVQFPSNGISYSQVCGRVTGYQYGSPDGVDQGHGSNHNNLNGDYVDGVSITRGSPRQHVWTLMAGIGETNSIPGNNCPCATGSTQQVQSFIGDHYFCESGVAAMWTEQLYTSDPLWDGQSCGSAESPCCNYLDPSLSSLSDTISLNNNTLVLSLITQLNNTMQDTANKVDVIGKFNKEGETFHENNTLLLNRVIETVSSSVVKLNNIISTLSNIQDTSTSTAGVVDGLLIVVQELLQLHNVSSSLPTSCKQLNDENPDSSSGIYILVSANGTSLYYAYCNMEELCGSGGGWTRLAYLDMSDSTVNCPSGLRLYQSGGVRACGRPVTSSGSCVSVQFPSNGISYSQVCGRVTGYQYYTPDAVDNNFVPNSSHNNLNGEYVDGVSITHGSPRQHVWTLMASSFEGNSDGYDIGPCANGSLQQVQSFVGDHYFCESAVATDVIRQKQLYTSDPLWDGQGCGSAESPCCNVPGIPWFHRDYGNTTTTDYIELRVCGDEGTANEDVPVSYYEIYVK
uniref:Fibrinogen C-terminal domain-containing protein n=1 Tax=Amphimedon queenslandica TaxID=400682 RepID=A0A1X7VPV2_AMPQE